MDNLLQLHGLSPQQVVTKALLISELEQTEQEDILPSL